MKSRKKTKIVATIGLASQEKEIIKKMFEAGMNVARLNFSHGTHQWHADAFKTIREVAKEEGRPIGILADLQGPRIRTVVDEELEIKKGDRLMVSDIANKESLEIRSEKIKSFLLDVANIVDDIEIGHDILVEDGLIKMTVKDKDGKILLCEVVDGGIIKNHKGVNIPDANLQISPITEKDERDLAFALDHGADFVAMSFVGNAKNIRDLRQKMIDHLGSDKNLPQIVSKIERKEAIKNLDEIIQETDVIMVARGDLGIEVEGSKVIVLQKEIIKKCLEYIKPVIVATQMLDSMIHNPRPTRAEISDVSNAVIDHVDAVMLSGESAGGKYPVESVETMADIIQNTEISPFDDVLGVFKVKSTVPYNEIVEGAYNLAKSCKARAIAMGSAGGMTARIMSHFRPEQKLFVVTHNEKTYNQLALVWGVRAQLFEKGGVFREDVDWLLNRMKEMDEVEKGDEVVVIMGRMEDDEKMKLLGLKEIE